MLRLALRDRDVREALGQPLRLAVAGPGSAAGKYPDGNTGRTRAGPPPHARSRQPRRAAGQRRDRPAPLTRSRRPHAQPQAAPLVGAMPRRIPGRVARAIPARRGRRR
ncbi:DUF3703 domain-containing protein [Streptomyces lydicus]